MVKRNASAKDEEPEQSSFDVPSEKEHLLQVADIFTHLDEIGMKMSLDENTVAAKLEVVGGDEEGRTLLNRCSLDDGYKGFFYTRLFLKAIGEPYKGDGFDIDTDRWQGRQLYATVEHDGKYANIKEYNFEKLVDNANAPVAAEIVPEEGIAWDSE